MNPGFLRQFVRSLNQSTIFGVMILLFVATRVSAAPPAKFPKGEAAKIVDEANRLADTQEAADYLKLCGPVFSPAVGRTFDKEHVPPEKPTLLQVIIVVRADGQIARILAVDNPFSIRFRKELLGTVLPKPPRDRWPTFLNTALVYHLDKDQ